MLIRPGRVDDALDISRIHIRAWQDAYRGIVPEEYLTALSIEQRTLVWQQRLASGRASVWVLHDGGEMLGWVSAAGSRDDDASPSTGEIHAVYVAPAHWRRGVGRMLCDHGERSLGENGFSDVTLWVFADNARALKFYASRGFVVDETARTVERAGKALLELRLRKQLSAC